jgi:hypothetical protein
LVEGPLTRTYGVFYDLYNFSIPFHLFHITKQLNIKSYILISKSIIIFILNQINLSGVVRGAPTGMINKFLGGLIPQQRSVIM